MIRMSVAGIGIDPVSSQPIVVLNDDERVRGLPIWIGALEARAISFAYHKVKPNRPMAHDLLINTISALRFRVDKVEIDRLDQSTYRATITLASSEEGADDSKTQVDARPSDAIAIALATGSPIYVSEELEFVIDKTQKEDEEFKEFLQDLKASDFNNAVVAAVVDDDGEDASTDPGCDTGDSGALRSDQASAESEVSGDSGATVSDTDSSDEEAGLEGESQ